MNSYRYRVVDVFTTTALEGNPLAVFPEADGLDSTTMQKIAKELNLAETAFVLPATRDDCASQVRIFTPGKEMLFAGHPTLGAGYVLHDEQQVSAQNGQFALEEKIGPVNVRVEPGERPRFWLTTPPIRKGRTYDRTLCAEVLGIPADAILPAEPQLLDAGNPTILIGVTGNDVVDSAWLDMSGLQRLKGKDTEAVCVFLFTPTPAGAYSRMFAPEYGVPEDPATGSSTGPLAQYMMEHHLIEDSRTEFYSEQGVKMGRRSVLHVRIDRTGDVTKIEVGGHVTPLIEARISLP